MNFANLELGSIIYYAEIKNTELIDGRIKTKSIDGFKKYYATDCIELKMSDGTTITPKLDKCYYIKNSASLQKINRPMDFVIYACSYDDCLKILTKLSDIKYKEINEEYKYISSQLSSICLLSSAVRNLNKVKNEELILKPTYAD